MGGKNCKSYSMKNKNSDNNKSTLTITSPSSLSSSSPAAAAASGDNDNDYVEGIVCNENDIEDNEMKLLELKSENDSSKGGKILLIKQKGQLNAIGTKCTHYGALLHTGALGDGRIRCPWHGACFNIKTGDIEDYPGLDSLPCYNVTVNNNGQVIVKARMKDLENNRRILKSFSSLPRELNDNNCSTVVIIGGGPAGATCADTLRQQGFNGNIIMICKESVLPYDRVKVSKIMDFDINKVLLRSQNYYDENNIITKLNTQAIELDTNNNCVKLNNNDIINYNYVFIATGSKPRSPNIPGIELNNIYFMRNYSDSVGINNKLSLDKHVVILGQSFIGMEAAAYCLGKCASVTVVGKNNIPLSNVFGDDIGKIILNEYQSKGVKFIFNTNIVKFNNHQSIDNENNKKDVSSVELTDGSTLKADIVIIGIGSTPYTDWLKNSNVNLRDDGTIIVDNYLKTNINNVYAGGDIAYAPVFVSDNNPASIGHYSLAQYHGKIAALNICNKEKPLRVVPFFWTTLFGKSYRYAGHGRATSIKIYGSLDNFKFFAYYIKDGKVIAMSSVGSDPIVSDFAEYIYEGNTLTQQQVDDNPIGWMRNKPVELLKNIFSDKFNELNNSFYKNIGFQKKHQQQQQNIKSFHTLILKNNNNNTYERLCKINFLFKFHKYLKFFRPM
ncbi:apoptosis-inducing factor 3 isoform X1 [Microplitis mediator]|uniref:apoptosis-inducing factor 3 isoform X1 n=2 Tax=Microplitis mediator TaxID=375433 RepID=UPI002554B5ED|nr:apoptosis-inducing factor 3 isoform X1 [Microplitis mediator]XP_057341131.1 apoptosis-inducing factor 3 isoform X1 [Microplitis mediator]